MMEGRRREEKKKKLLPIIDLDLGLDKYVY